MIALTAHAFRYACDVGRRFFFPASTGLNASICRVVLVGAQMFWFPQGLAWQLNYIRNNEDFVEPEPLIALLSMIFGQDNIRIEALFESASIAMVVAGWMALVGLFTRPALIVFTAANMLYITHGYSYGEHHHREAIYLLTMMLLAFSPCNRYFSVDALIAKYTGLGRSPDFLTDMQSPTVDAGMWAVRLGMTLLAIAYFMAGLCKLVRGGPEWLNGYTMQRFIFQDAVRYDLPLGLWVAHHWWLCFAMGIGAVVFELGFISILWKRRLAFIFLPMGLVMHILILYLQKAPFYHFMVLYVLFINFEWFFQRQLVRTAETNEFSHRDAE